jgi:ribosomal protein L11 methyltransferase
MEPSIKRPGRSYVKAAFVVAPELADDAAAILIAHGALGCVVKPIRHAQHPQMETWYEDRLNAERPAISPQKTRTLEAFFERLSNSQLAEINRALAAAGMTDNRHAPRAARIVDPGWSTRWRSRFKPLPIGRRLLIVPPWAGARRPGRINLTINPAQAFGTGHHGSTAGALVMIERLCARFLFRAGLDVGCGSGILSIAMRMLGVARVVGIDTDRHALDNARENLSLNQINSVRFSAAPLQTLKQRFDLAAANILSSTLIELAPTLIGLINPGARLVLGGILERERNAVLRRFRPRLTLDDELVDRGWVTLVMRR